METTLEQITDAAIFEALRQASPGLVDAVSNLLAMGITPAQIEQRAIRRAGGQTQTTRNVRHVAEHLRRIG